MPSLMHTKSLLSSFHKEHRALYILMHTELANEYRERQLQYFWEVFPAQDGITTYMFAYTDPTAGMAPNIMCCSNTAATVLTLISIAPHHILLLPREGHCTSSRNVLQVSLC